MLKGMHGCFNFSWKFRLYEAWKISRRGGERANGRGREEEITEELSRLLSPTFFITALPFPASLTLPTFGLLSSSSLSMESLPLSSPPSFIFPSFHGLHWVLERRNEHTTAWTRVKRVFSTARADSGRGDNGPRTNPFSSVAGRSSPSLKLSFSLNSTLAWNLTQSWGDCFRLWKKKIYTEIQND